MSALSTDSFTRADANPVSGNWKQLLPSSSNMQIVSNAVTPVSTSLDCGIFNYDITFPADQYSQVKITVNGTTGGGRGMGVCLRCSLNASNQATYYRVVADHAASNNVELSKFINGTQTIIWTRTQSWSDGALLYAEIRGKTLRVSIAGTDVGATAVDETIMSGPPGVVYSSSTTSASADDWEGGSFGFGYYDYSSFKPPKSNAKSVG